MSAVAEPVLVPVPAPTPPQTQQQKIAVLQKTVSASRLSCWLTCRLKFFFRYVQKISKSPSPALHVGSVVHTVLQQWNLDRWRRQPFETKRMKELFDKRWPEQEQVKINWDGRRDGQNKPPHSHLIEELGRLLCRWFGERTRLTLGSFFSCRSGKDLQFSRMARRAGDNAWQS